MTKSPRQPAATDLREAAELFQPFLAANNRGIEALLATNQTLLGGLSEMVADSLTFAGKRLQADLRALEAAQTASSPKALTRAQWDFARDAAQAYLSESGKLAGLLVRTTQDCLKDLTPAFKAPGAPEGLR